MISVRAAQGKTGEMANKNSLSGKTQETWKFTQNTGKRQEFSFSQVVNSLLLKIQDITIFVVKILIFQKSVSYNEISEIATGKKILYSVYEYILYCTYFHIICVC